VLPDTLVGAIQHCPPTSRGVIGCESAGEKRISWARLYEWAKRLAGELQARGLEPRQTVLIVGGTSIEMAALVEAVVLCGASLAMMQSPALASRGVLGQQIRTRARHVNALAVVLDQESRLLRDALVPDLDAWTLQELLSAAESRNEGGHEVVATSPSDLAVLQFTSGTTAEPRAVGVSNQNIMQYLSSLYDLTRFDPQAETLVSWLPLYHDMGLIGYLLCGMVTGADLLLAPPNLFVLDPSRWLSWISRYPSVHSAGPSFAYAMLARTHRAWGDVDLSNWRLAANGGEHIDYDTALDFCNRAEPVGFRREAMVCTYGLAEATLAVTASFEMGGLRGDVIHRPQLEMEGVAAPASPDSTDAQVLVRLGRSLPCAELRVVDRGTGRPVEERQVGEVQVSGSTVTSGYFGEPELNSGLFDGRWLRTGDLGYLAEGELIVCARLKDVIVVAGRNISPYEVESATAQTAGIRTGNVAAFGVPSGRGTEQLIIVAEFRGTSRSIATRSITRDVKETIGLSPADVVLVPPSAVPKTSSGKVQRHLCRRRYIEGAFD
jgi:fatty-acyl-CoA synthase